MTQDDAGSARMLGSVWCRVSINERRADGRVYGLVDRWVQVDMPFIMPIGTTVDLPTPRKWTECEMEGEIKGWSVSGGVAHCYIEATGYLDSDDVADLEEIGYIGDDCEWPATVQAGVNRMYR